MGVEAKYRRVTEKELNRLQTDKKFAARFFAFPTVRTIAAALIDFIKKAKAIESTSEQPSAVPKENERVLDIDKDWQAIHFLLTGEFCFSGESKTPPPMGNVIMGGVETMWESTYGKIRLLSQRETKDVAEALKKISRKDLKPRRDPKAFNKHKVYPAHDRWNADDLKPLLDIFDQLKAFFLKAAELGELVLISFD
jgi:Domain of unknown function (DUF1877)